MIEGTYTPAIQCSVLELQSQADAMKNSTDGAIPILRNVFTKYGLLHFKDHDDLKVPETQNVRGRNKSFIVDIILSFVNLSSISFNAHKNHWICEQRVLNEIIP